MEVVFIVKNCKIWFGHLSICEAKLDEIYLKLVIDGYLYKVYIMNNKLLIRSWSPTVKYNNAYYSGKQGTKVTG